MLTEFKRAAYQSKLSIYGTDATTISRRGVIININKYRWEKVQEVNLL